MNKIIIGLFRIYIYLAVIGLVVSTVFLSSFDARMLLLLAVIIPLIFGMTIIQIDNNQVLHEINNNIRRGLPEEKDSDFKNLTESQKNYLRKEKEEERKREEKEKLRIQKQMEYNKKRGL
tara:strand:+ start:660 stop:1019 length:360 start_codon:yes stop_codon:yes gene_type:complete